MNCCVLEQRGRQPPNPMLPPFSFELTPPPTNVTAEDHWRSFTYLQYIDGVSAEMYSWSLSWVQVCRFARQLPPGVEFFAGCLASLGLDRLELTPADLRSQLLAVAGSGARVPGTAMKLRVARPWLAIFEEAVGREPLLPATWLKGLEVHGDPSSFWIGDRVPQHPICPAHANTISDLTNSARNHMVNIDSSAYQLTSRGWKLKGSGELPAFFNAVNQ